MSIRPRSSLLDPSLQRPSALNSQPRDPSLIWLDKNENLDPALLDVTVAALHAVSREALACYPEAGELYRKLGAWAGVSPDSLLLTPGSDGAIRLTFEAFVESGDTVFITDPTFAMYPVYAKMFGAQVTALQYHRANRALGWTMKLLLNRFMSKSQSYFVCPTLTVQPVLLRL